jgi:hypothetical protein
MAEGQNIGPTKTARYRGLQNASLPIPRHVCATNFERCAGFKRLSTRTEEAYWGWTRRYLVFHKRNGAWRHPRELAAPEVQAFLTHLAAQRNVAASTQNQALNALVFLYREVLGIELEAGMEFERAKTSAALAGGAHTTGGPKLFWL